MFDGVWTYVTASREAGPRSFGDQLCNFNATGATVLGIPGFRATADNNRLTGGRVSAVFCVHADPNRSGPIIAGALDKTFAEGSREGQKGQKAS